MDSPNYEDQIHQILNGSNAISEMENFIMKLSQQGHSKKKIYNMLLKIHAKMADNEAYNILSDTLDKLIGWGSLARENPILPDEK